MKTRSLTLAAAIAAVIGIAAPALAQPAPGGWDINRRIEWTQARIIRGRDTGALDRREFFRVQGELNGVKRETERTRMMEGGRIDERHRFDLEGKLDRINNQIHWIRQMDERRPW